MKILLADDEKLVRDGLKKFLVKLGHELIEASDGKEALEKYHAQKCDLVITDIKMPNLDGLELLRRLKQVEKAPADVVIITAHGDMESALRALKFGAYDYLQKPVDVRELAIVIERCQEYRRIRKKFNELQVDFDEKVAAETQACHLMADQLREAYLDELGLDKLLVFSEVMRAVVQLAEKYSADRSLPVLIEGESGTGKDLLAQYIHYMGSAARTRPFIVINCAAMPEQLVEAELFGHEAGAFTGAKSNGSMGKLEAASGGTIFLDEIGEMPLKTQGKLLRAVEDNKFYRVGGVKEIPVDVRLIAATNKMLSKEVEAGLFRLDLYYRINIGYIQIPPLRERKEEIIPLANKFGQRSALRKGYNFAGFSAGAQKKLLSYDWPGNVRELKNSLERLVMLAPGRLVQVDDVAFLGELGPYGKTLESKIVLGEDEAFELPERGFDLEDWNCRIVREALAKHGNNKTRTALYLGISRRVLHGKIKKYSLQ